jgi:hypothetical protein
VEEVAAKLPSLGFLPISRQSTPLSTIGQKLEESMVVYDPPGDGLCGFCCLYLILLLMQLDTSFVWSSAAALLQAVKSPQILRDFLVKRRTADDVVAIKHHNAEMVRLKKGRGLMRPLDWCAFADIHTFAILCGFAIVGVYNGFSRGAEFRAERCGSVASGGTGRNQIRMASLGLVCVKGNHFVAVDIARCYPPRISLLEYVLGGCGKEGTDDGNFYSYDDTIALDQLQGAAEDEDKWLQGFWPRAAFLGWQWSRTTTDDIKIYTLENKRFSDNGSQVKGLEGLRQYYLTSGEERVGRSMEGVQRKRKRPGKLND